MLRDSGIWIPDLDYNDKYAEIEKYIVVGSNINDSMTLERLIKEEDIGAVLCVHRKDLRYDPTELDVDFLQVKFADGRIMPFANVVDAIDFLKSCVDNKKRIYVHCEMGISRSPTIVILYYIIFKKINFSDAFQRVISVKPDIVPHPNLVDLDLLADLFHHYGKVE